MLLVLVDNLDVSTINSATGELFHTLTIRPTRDDQPQKTRKLPNP
jgi:hypothetical protein